MAWTETTRLQHDSSSLRYASDTTDEEWALIAPFMPPPNRRGSISRLRNTSSSPGEATDLTKVFEMLARKSRAISLCGWPGFTCTPRLVTGITRERSSTRARRPLGSSERLQSHARSSPASPATMMKRAGFSTRLGSVTLRGDFIHNSGYFQDTVNTGITREDGYNLLNLRASFTDAQDRFEIAAFATNVTDELYYANAGSAIDSLGVASINPGRPREWGVSVTAHF